MSCAGLILLFTNECRVGHLSLIAFEQRVSVGTLVLGTLGTIDESLSTKNTRSSNTSTNKNSSKNDQSNCGSCKSLSQNGLGRSFSALKKIDAALRNAARIRFSLVVGFLLDAVTTNINESTRDKLPDTVVLIKTFLALGLEARITFHGKLIRAPDGIELALTKCSADILSAEETIVTLELVGEFTSLRITSVVLTNIRINRFLGSVSAVAGDCVSIIHAAGNETLVGVVLGARIKVVGQNLLSFVANFNSAVGGDQEILRNALALAISTRGIA